ncbi:sugar phosphate nucleotidyltransferase [Vibrio coralliirubri]|uniref:phosphocholine cytidylyltransferase family protein n=1 Tax=Vibrio coralliirubri TaxID=1516159 RepID=UPI000EFDA726|nr:phosphocholine cytidylyltransferase family protein [Vibrio coralliirubri]
MTKAIILAAGQGTRLRPLTNNKPKCLVPFLGKPLINYQIEVLNNSGIDDINVVTGYKKEEIEKLGLNTTYNHSYENTNMVTSLFSAIDFINSCEEDLIISYGDIIYQSENLTKLLECEDEMALMIDKDWRKLWDLRLENPLDDAETLVINEHGFISEIGKKPQSYDEINGQYTGLIKIKSNKIKDIVTEYNELDRDAQYDGNNFDNMYLTSFIQHLIDKGWRIKASLVSNGWLEVDSVDDLNCYEKLSKNNELDSIIKV